MNKLLICGLLMWLSAGALRAECNPKNSIALVSSKPGSKRDWVKDFDKLDRKYSKSLNTNKLILFFRDQKGPKECISLTDLNRLSTDAQQIFKGSVDPDVVKFRNAISGVAKKNPPQAGSETASTTPLSTSPNTPVGATAVTASEDIAPDAQTALDASPEIASDTGGSPQPGTSAGADDQTESGQSPWFWVSIGLGVLALALGGLAFWLNSQIKTQKMRFDKKSRDDSFALRQDLQTNFDKVSKEKFDRLTIENQKLQQTNDELMRDLSKLERQTGTGSSAASTVAAFVTQTAASPQPVPPSPEPPPVKAFFLSTPTPTSDGLCTFLDQRKAQFDPTSSLYRFELVNNNESEARFRFESTSGTVSGALAYPDTYLHPACDYTGLDSKATRIETTQSGKATRQGNVWKVVEKARIKFV